MVYDLHIFSKNNIVSFHYKQWIQLHVQTLTIYSQYLVTPQLHVVNANIRRQYGWSIYVTLA